MDFISALQQFQSRINNDIDEFISNLQSGAYSMPASLEAMLETSNGVRAKSPAPYSVKYDDIIVSEITGQRTFELALLRKFPHGVSDIMVWAIPSGQEHFKWNHHDGFYFRAGFSIKKQIRLLESFGITVIR